MAPTAILAKQHYNLAKKYFETNIKIKLLTGKTETKIEKNIDKLIKAKLIY